MYRGERFVCVDIEDLQARSVGELGSSTLGDGFEEGIKLLLLSTLSLYRCLVFKLFLTSTQDESFRCPTRTVLEILEVAEAKDTRVSQVRNNDSHTTNHHQSFGSL